MRKSTAGQLDLLDLLDDRDSEMADTLVEAGIGRLYSLGAASLDECRAAFAEWTRDFGVFDSVRIAHAWLPVPTTPATSTDYCAAAVLTADTRCEHPRRWRQPRRCSCVGNDAPYRAICRGCGWTGQIVTSLAEATDDYSTHHLIGAGQ